MPTTSSNRPAPSQRGKAPQTSHQASDPYGEISQINRQSSTANRTRRGFQVSFGYDDRAPVEHAVIPPLAQAAALGVAACLDLETPEGRSEGREIGAAIRPWHPELIV